jgi:two-component system, OmpR family, response regulator RegX3
MRIAILEDDPSQGELLQHWLRQSYRPHLFAQGAGLLHILQTQSVKFDALILDWNLPDLSGIAVLRHVRQSSHPNIPVLFSTARAPEEDVVAALRAGADDYVVKPLRCNEFLARLNAIMPRKRHAQPEPAIVNLGHLCFDRAGRRLLRDGVPVQLSGKDFDLAALFLSNIGRLLSRAQIIEAVWRKADVMGSRTIDTHVSRVRTKLGLSAENGWHFGAIYGLGYRLERVTVHDRPAQRAHPACLA